MTTLNFIAHTYPVGDTVFHRSLPNGRVNTFTVACDASPWTTVGTLRVLVESSFDGGTVYETTTSVGETGPPPWPADHGTTSALGFTATYPDGEAPTDVRLTITVTGNPISLGAGSITVN